jgi:hypothetical protein
MPLARWGAMMSARPPVPDADLEAIHCDVHGLTVQVIAWGGLVAEQARRSLRLFLVADPQTEPTFRIVIVESQPPGRRRTQFRPRARPVYEKRLSPEVRYVVRVSEDCVVAAFEPGGFAAVSPQKGNAVCVVEPRALARWPGLPAVMLERALLELLARHSWFGVHAAGIERDGRAALLCGGGSAGKTTACLTLVASGFRCLGDDKLLLQGSDSAVTAWPLSAEVGVCPESLPLLPSAIRQTIAAAEAPGAKVWLPLDDVAPGGQAESGVPVALLFPELDASSGCQLSALPTADAMTKLTEQGLAICSPGAEGRFLEVATALLSQASAFRLVLGRDIDRLPALVGEALAASG